tara:strand:+ start:1368 stop:2021 length:654 start_codon:yes stop_codon:yes gene_type:complete
VSPVVVVIAVLFVVVVLAGLAFMRRSGADELPGAVGGSPALRPAPETRDRIFFLRFEGADDEDYVGGILGRHGGKTTSAAKAREMALDLVRAAPTATHVHAGPAADAPAGPGLARIGLPGGVVVGFHVVSTRKLGTVADDTDLSAVVAELRAVAAFTDAELQSAELIGAETDVDANAPALIAVDPSTRPGHQQCSYCRTSFPAHDTRCPACGARVGV